MHTLCFRSCPEIAASEEVMLFLGCPAHLVSAAAELQQWSVAGEGYSTLSRPPMGLRMMRHTTAGVCILFDLCVFMCVCFASVPCV